MRKTRLVILPTKCLHQMGFLLLFLSCPVIGDWGRIRPESANSHKAIQIDKEGTCGLQRDTPGGLLEFFTPSGIDQCRLSEHYGLNESLSKEGKETSRQNTPGRRVQVARNNIRRATERSKSVESRRLSTLRSTVRSLSLNRQGRSETRMWRETEVEIASRKTNQRIARQPNEKERDSRNDRREIGRVASERLSRRSDQVQNERTSRREGKRLALTRREYEFRQETPTRRLPMRSIEKNENSNRRNRETENVRIRRNNEEIRTFRQIRSLDFRKEADKSRQFRRELETRRQMLLNQKSPESKISGLNRENSQRVKKDEREINGRKMGFWARTESWRLSNKNPEKGKFLEGIASWMPLNDKQYSKIGEWTANCIIGAVAYYVTSRNVKTV